MYGNWKKFLAVIWPAHFLSISGFSFGLPVAPFYLHERGVKPGDQLNFWVSIFAAATPLTLIIFSP